jgi:outer membrane protein OmpA-like peptidoglycan-associated protein
MMRPERARRNLAPAIAVGAVGLLAIGIGQSIPNRHAIERDLTDRSTQALQAAGVSGAEVSFVGRDGEVRLGSPADQARVSDIVRAQAGVRVVTVVVPVRSSVTGTDAPAVTPSLSPSPSRAAPSTAPQVQQKLVEVPPITFLNDSATLTPEGRSAVEQAAALLSANPGVRVSIEGHTDSRGTAAKNLALSRARAQTVVATLRSLGVDAGRMTSDGFGETRPKVADDSPANQAINRRVEFIVQQ